MLMETNQIDLNNIGNGSKNHKLIRILIIVCIALVFVTSFFIYQNYHLRQLETMQISEDAATQRYQKTIENKVTPSTFISNDMTEYASSEYGVSFRYPRDFQIKETPIQLSDGTFGPVSTVQLSTDRASITILFYAISGYVQNYSEADLTTQENIPVLIDGKALVINGKKIYKTRFYNAENHHTWYELELAYPDKRDYQVVVSYTTPDGAADAIGNQIFDRIVSTISFKRLAINNSWSNYSDLPIGLTFMYPKDTFQICQASTSDIHRVLFWDYGYSCELGNDAVYKISIETFSSDVSHENGTPTSESKIMVQGIDAIEKIYHYDEQDGPLYKIPYSKEIVFQRGESTISFHLLDPNVEDIFDQMISSIQFDAR